MPRRACAWLLAILPILAGCMHFTHKPPDDCLMRPADTVPEESKACVYVFLFDTYNPFASGALGGVRDQLYHLGFGKTFYGWPHHVEDFLAEAQLVQADRPNARFAVSGYGLGASAARRFTAEASEMGIVTDVIIYLEPSGMEPWDEAEAALDVVIVRAEDLECSGGHHHVSKSSVPTHPATLEVIERELTLMAMGVPPPPRPRPQRVLLVPAIPAPREKIPIPKELPLEWQFLRPRHPWDVPPPAPRYGGETLPYPQALPDLPPPREVK